MYDPTLEEEEKIENDQYGGRRTAEHILIPETGGIFEILPFSLPILIP